MENVTGIVGAAPIFNRFMQQALAGRADSWFAVPSGLNTMEANGYTAYLIPGTEQVAAASQPPPLPADNGGGGDND